MSEAQKIEIDFDNLCIIDTLPMLEAWLKENTEKSETILDNDREKAQDNHNFRMKQIEDFYHTKKSDIEIEESLIEHEENALDSE